MARSCSRPLSVMSAGCQAGSHCQSTRKPSIPSSGASSVRIWLSRTPVSGQAADVRVMVMTAVRSWMLTARTKPRSTMFTPRSGSMTSDSASRTAQAAADGGSPVATEGAGAGAAAAAGGTVAAGGVAADAVAATGRAAGGVEAGGVQGDPDAAGGAVDPVRYAVSLAADADDVLGRLDVSVGHDQQLRAQARGCGLHDGAVEQAGELFAGAAGAEPEAGARGNDGQAGDGA